MESGLAQEALVAREVLARRLPRKLPRSAAWRRSLPRWSAWRWNWRRRRGGPPNCGSRPRRWRPGCTSCSPPGTRSWPRPTRPCRRGGGPREQRRREEEERRRREAIQQALLGPAGGVSDEITPGFVCRWRARRCSSIRGGLPFERPGPYGDRPDGCPRQPLVAVADGTIQLASNAVGGNTVWLYADHGVSYFYAHLDGFAGSPPANGWAGAR